AFHVTGVQTCALPISFDGLGRVTPCVDGVSASLEAALDAAAERLAAARLPLFGGLATDVQGMRALYRLANVGGAILDHAHGEAKIGRASCREGWLTAG